MWTIRKSRLRSRLVAMWTDESQLRRAEEAAEEFVSVRLTSSAAGAACNHGRALHNSEQSLKAPRWWRQCSSSQLASVEIVAAASHWDSCQEEALGVLFVCTDERRGGEELCGQIGRGKWRLSQVHCMSGRAHDSVILKEDYLILHVIVATAVHAILPGCCNFPLWDSKGIVMILLLHAGPTEFVYHWLHRALHHHFLFTRYHSHHHASFVTEPVSGSVHPFLEHVSYSAVFAIPLVGAWALGGGSIGMFYFYWLFFDLMNAIGHCNWEFFPPWVFNVFPPLKYLVYTPTYRIRISLYLCLFMIIWVAPWTRTATPSIELSAKVKPYPAASILTRTLCLVGRTEKLDFVFLAHGTELLSAFHLPSGIASFAAHPYESHWYLLPLWPLAVIAMLGLWMFGKVFTADKYKLDKLNMQTWVIPRYGFQYFLPFERKRINHLIEDAILKADARGAQVISLGALNKNEALNGGGALFVEKHPNLRIRVCHGNTLTAAVILDKLPKGVSEIFLTGATSKLGRAIALYLCRRRVRVLMLTTSRDRFESVLHEAPAELQRYLVQVTKYQDGQQCKTWVVGKWIKAEDQKWAPPGTHFHQFVVPPIQEFRKDCTYEELAGMRLPKAVKGLRSCEMTMPRGCVHACHAGGLVHGLEGWKHNEVGAIDVDQIDVTWKAAMSHGFLPM